MNKKRTIFRAIIILIIIFLLYKISLVIIFNEYFTTSPNIIGLNKTIAVKYLKKAKLRYIIAGSGPSIYDKGLIFLQEPTHGTELKRNHIIKIWISNQKNKNITPNWVNMDYISAENLATKFNIDVVKVIFVHSTKPLNTIIATDPAPDIINNTQKIKFLVSYGETKQVTIIPDLIGTNFDDAEKSLKKAGLILGNVEYETNDNFSTDIILKTIPDAANKVPKGTIVNIKVNK